jgi:hypothetical protein
LKWLAQLKEDGKAVKTLEDVPTILPHAVWVWAAFSSLSRKRAIGPEGAQPIAMSEILAYAVYHDISGEGQRTDLFEIISSLDAAFLTHLDKQRKKRASKDRRPAPGKPHRPPRRGKRR